MSNQVELRAALDAERCEIEGRAGRLSYYVAGSGPPFLALHSINAAASAYEIRPLFQALAKQFRVYSPDLPGYGFSDRSRRPYDVRLFTDAVHDMLDVIRREHGDTPVHAQGLSLSCEFLARAASESPERFDSLVLVTPTGFSKGGESLTEVGKTRELPGFLAFFEFPLWRKPLFNALVRKGTIRYFLKRTYGSADVDEDLVDYDYLTAHQPGAENAPFAFLSGRLFSKDIRLVYERLEHPIWVPHGTKGDFKDFRDATWAKDLPNWTFEPFETGALVHYERLADFLNSLQRFLTQGE